MSYAAIAALLILGAEPAHPKRDPFQAPAAERPETPPVAPPYQRCERMACRYDLSELRLVAIVFDGLRSVAMFENPRGSGISVKRNDEVGTRGGRVSRITRECVTVREYRPAGDGRLAALDVEVCMPPPPTDGAESLAETEH